MQAQKKKGNAKKNDLDKIDCATFYLINHIVQNEGGEGAHAQKKERESKK